MAMGHSFNSDSDPWMNLKIVKISVRAMTEAPNCVVSSVLAYCSTEQFKYLQLWTLRTNSVEVFGDRGEAAEYDRKTKML